MSSTLRVTPEPPWTARPAGLLKTKTFGIFMDQHLGQHVGVALVADRVTGQRALALLVDLERRNAHHLARLDAGVGLDPAAIDADLAGAQQLLQMAEAKAREMGLEPAIEPHARLAGLHRDLFNACHIFSLSVSGRLA